MKVNDCLFCKIINKDIVSDYVLETDRIIVINDIDPQAPEHFLIIPKKHIPTLNELRYEDIDLVGEMIFTASKLANDIGLSHPGYRAILNCKEAGGQTVFHIHLHLLGGRKLNWPPG